MSGINNDAVELGDIKRLVPITLEGNSGDSQQGVLSSRCNSW
jgi:hypothetical protein